LPTGEAFFQRAEVWGFSVMVDYWPRRLDLAALKAGNLAEVLNLAPWGNVLLQLRPLRLAGAHGWANLGAALGEHWLRDITSTQVCAPGALMAPVLAAWSRVLCSAHSQW
jgi:autophagy-related protein 2